MYLNFATNINTVVSFLNLSTLIVCGFCKVHSFKDSQTMVLSIHHNKENRTSIKKSVQQMSSDKTKSHNIHKERLVVHSHCYINSSVCQHVIEF